VFCTSAVRNGKSDETCRVLQPTLNPDSSPVRDLVLFDRTAAWRDMLDPKEKKLVFQRGDVVYLM